MRYQAIEAIVQQGKIVPIEPIEMQENTHFLLIKLNDFSAPAHPVFKDVQRSRGKFKGQLSTVEEFMAQKTQEKVLDL